MYSKFMEQGREVARVVVSIAKRSEVMVWDTRIWLVGISLILRWFVIYNSPFMAGSGKVCKKVLCDMSRVPESI